MKISITELYRLFLEQRKISTDSRHIKEEAIFFALKGESFDGNIFANQALEAGASYAVIDNEKYQTNSRCLLVENVVTTLQHLALHHRLQFNIPVIGITGTNGKTTTKELTGHILARKFNTIYTQGNLNNHIGVPLSVLSFKQETEIAVIEMGANHVGEIASLCQISQPTHGIVTNIGRAHLEGFGSFEGVMRAKSELYDFLKKNHGFVFLHADDNLLAELSIDIPKITYGAGTHEGLQGKIIEKSRFLSAKIHFKTGTRIIHTQMIGNYNFANIMAAASIGEYFGVEPNMICEAIENYTPSNNRSQFIVTNHNQIVMDAYNANPTSMESAILSFLAFDGAGKIAILGDMRELGKESLTEHQHVLELALAQNFESVYLVGDQFSQVSKGHHVQGFQNVEEACEFFQKKPLKSKTVLIKASRGTQLEKLMEVL